MNEKATPAEMVAIEPAAKYSTMENYIPKDRQLVVNWPGLISIAGDRGYFPGCRLVTFRNYFPPIGLSAEDCGLLYGQSRTIDGASFDATTGTGWPSADDQLNAFAQHRGNLAIVDWRITNAGDIKCLITTQLDGDNLEDFQEAGRIMEIEMRRLREERAKRTAEAEEQKAKQAAEDAETMTLGRKAKEHNLLNKLRQLDEENADLKARLKTYEKAAKKGGK